MPGDTRSRVELRRAERQGARQPKRAYEHKELVCKKPRLNEWGILFSD